MPTVTTGVNALLTTTGTTTAHGTLTKVLQGAVADATRIGAEYMPEELSIISVTLANTGSVTLPAGTLGLNAAGKMILHNNVANGSKMESFLRSNARQDVGEVFSGVLFRDDYARPLATFIVPASQAVTNRQLLVSGTLWLGSGLISDTLPTLFLGFNPTGNATIGDMHYIEMPAASLVAGKVKLDFMIPWSLSADGTASYIPGNCGGICTPISITTETTTVSKSAFAAGQGSTGSLPLVTMGSTSSFDVFLVGIDGGPALIGTYYVYGNLSLNFATP